VYVTTITLLFKVIIRLHVSTIDQSSSGLFCQLSHKMLCTLWDPIALGWDPKVCIASCDTIDKIGLRMTNLKSKRVAL